MVNKSAMQGFRTRKMRSGSTYYYFDGGQGRKEIPLGSDYVTAVRQWSELVGSDPVAVADFSQLADRYEREVMPLKAKSTQATARGDMKMLRQFFCSPTPAPLDQIKPSHIHQLLQWKKANPTTANRLKRAFSHMFNMARAWGYTERENPVTGIRGFELGKRTTHTTDAVFKAVWEAGSQPLRDAMDLAYLTGQRPGDVLSFSLLDIVDGALTVKQKKTGKPLKITITGEFGALIERIAARRAGYKVWCANLALNAHGMPLTKQTLRKQFEAARLKAAADHPALADDIKAMWFYDLRAKAADDTAETHGEQAASNQLGHDSVTTTQRHYLRRGKTVGPTK
jgi:integrase